MDAITLTVLFKGAGMIFALLAGIITVRYGYNLYKDGAGHGRDKAAFEVGSIKVGAHSVGSVVMSTAFLWGMIGVWLSPSITKKGGDIEVYSLDLPNTKLEGLALVSDPVEAPERVVEDSEQLKAVFSAVAISKASDSKKIPWLKIDGKAALLAPSSISYLKSEDGQILITAEAKTDSKNAKIAFMPTVNTQNQIVFEPEGISKPAVR